MGGGRVGAGWREWEEEGGEGSIMTIPYMDVTLPAVVKVVVV